MKKDKKLEQKKTTGCFSDRKPIQILLQSVASFDFSDNARKHLILASQLLRTRPPVYGFYIEQSKSNIVNSQLETQQGRVGSYMIYWAKFRRC